MRILKAPGTQSVPCGSDTAAVPAMKGSDTAGMWGESTRSDLGRQGSAQALWRRCLEAVNGSLERRKWLCVESGIGGDSASVSWAS